MLAMLHLVPMNDYTHDSLYVFESTTPSYQFVKTFENGSTVMQVPDHLSS